eukprot:365495-Chlamydomonas_euryale.AAC.18
MRQLGQSVHTCSLHIGGSALAGMHSAVSTQARLRQCPHRHACGSAHTGTHAAVSTQARMRQQDFPMVSARAKRTTNESHGQTHSHVIASLHTAVQAVQAAAFNSHTCDYTYIIITCTCNSISAQTRTHTCNSANFHPLTLNEVRNMRHTHMHLSNKLKCCTLCCILFHDLPVSPKTPRPNARSWLDTCQPGSNPS